MHLRGSVGQRLDLERQSRSVHRCRAERAAEVRQPHLRVRMKKSINN